MRISDRQFQLEYLKNMNSIKSKLGKVQEQITTGKSINRSSDSPLGSSRLLKLNNHLGTINTFRENITYSKNYLNESISIMGNFQTEIDTISTYLAEIQNPTLGDNVRVYGDKIELAINALIDMANSEYDGQYLFGGTDHSVKPFAMNSSGTSVDANSQGIHGEKKIRIAKYIDQKFNITGKELFQSVLKESGTLDSAQVIGSTFTTTNSVYNADGMEYDFTIQYEKTAANTYEMTYSYDDGSGSVTLAQTNNLVFDSSTGMLSTVDGDSPKDIQINIPGEKIDFLVDIDRLTESSSNSISSHLTQKASIFNTLISIKDGLKNGQLPNDAQSAIVREFNQIIINKLSLAGDVSNRLDGASELLANQELELQSLRSEESDVDVLKAMVELESQQTNLDLGYRISSLILPKSLMDFL